MLYPKCFCGMSKFIYQNDVDNIYSWDLYKACFGRDPKKVTFHFSHVMIQSTVWELGKVYIEFIDTLIQM